MLSAHDVVACQGPEDQRINSTQTAEEISEGVEWNDPPTSSPDKVSPPCRIGPEGMESNRLNEYLFQLWIQNQVWFLGPPTQHVMKQSPALKKGAPCPAELEAELVLSFLVTLSLCRLLLAERSLRGRRQGDVQGSTSRGCSGFEAKLPGDYPEAEMGLRWKQAGPGPEREGGASLARRNSFRETCFDHPGASETPWLCS